MFSRPDQGGVAFDVNDLVRETIALLRGDLEAASVSVELWARLFWVHEQRAVS
jgi:hypothetical protein